MPCECDDKTPRNYYRYYDTPEGCDIDKKVQCIVRYGVVTGLIASSFDILMYSHAVGLANMLKRCLLHTAPLAGMGATFALVSYGALKARNIDDHYNYFLGGLACGPIAAWYVGSKHAILLGGLALGVAAVIKKDSITNGYALFPDFPHHMGMVDSWRHDYTLARDPRDDLKHTCGKKPC